MSGNILFYFREHRNSFGKGQKYFQEHQESRELWVNCVLGIVKYYIDNAVFI